FLTRFPEKNVSIAVLCNRGDAPLGAFVRQIGDIFLSPVKPGAKKEWDVKSAGLYRDPKTDAIVRFFVNDGALRAGYGGNGFEIDPEVFTFVDADHVRLANFNGYQAVYTRVPEWTPGETDLKKLIGSYRSDE